ncbi:MAG TPA: HYR domain-containing protein, partial [Anaerolineales bacterium]|nr:HYR domain-containing protein [Anaerolineales bacterium]
MSNRKHIALLAVFLIIVISVNFLNVGPVRADGETPTEPAAPTQEATEPPAEPPAESTPEPVEATPQPVEAAETPLAEILTQVPEDTNVVVLNEDGDPLPLTSQEAADVVEQTDPMWCPEGVSPGGPGCTTNFASISLLINNMVNPSNTASYAQNGVIYFTADPGSGNFNLSEANLGSTVYNTLKPYNLTLKGGWDGNTASPSFSGQTDFSNRPITIGSSSNPWIGNITVNDLTFTGASQTSLTVYTTTGNITLNNVDVNNQAGGHNTALLDSDAGNITVADGTFDGNGTNSAGFSATTDSGAINVSDSSFTDNKKSGAGNNVNGADLSASSITLTNVTATNNDGNGISIQGANTVTFNNVVASNNGTDPPGAVPNIGSGVFFNGNAGSILFINGGAFNNNKRYGVELANPANTTIKILSAPSCTGNVSGCTNGTFVTDLTAPTLTLPADITTPATSPAGAIVSYSASATDDVDPSVSVTCSPASGSLFAVGTTTVNCSASDVAGNTASGSFQVTVQQDTTPPALTLPADITVNIAGSSAVVTYSASANDAVDGPTSVSCVPASGSSFAVGTTTVNCFSSDASGNIALGSFQVTVVDTTVVVTPTPPAPPASGSGSEGSASGSPNSPPVIIPVTGGKVIDLDCDSAFWAFGIKLSFTSLCDYQTTLENVNASDLPGALPDGYSFVMGLDLDILSEGEVIDALPNGAGIQFDFPLLGESRDQFAVLTWNGS